MRKTLAFMLIISLLLMMTGCSSHTEQEQIELSLLQLDQDETFIALSGNDDSGYNRWIPLYIYVETKNDCEVNDLENFLQNNFTQLILYNGENKELYKSNELIWSAFKVSDCKFNISLIINPKIGTLPIIGCTQIKKALLNSNEKDYSFKLYNYFIEERTTLSEDLFQITSATIDTKINSDLTSEINYEITDVSDKFAYTISLDYQSNFDVIKNYAIRDRKTENNVDTFYIDLNFAEIEQRIVFRPFIKISYDNKEGWLVPPLPAYISKLEQ